MSATAKVFWSGRSQAVRLPKQFRFAGDEVTIYRREDGAIVLQPPGVDRLIERNGEAAASAIDRLRDAIVDGLASGPAAPWDADEVKRQARQG